MQSPAAMRNSGGIVRASPGAALGAGLGASVVGSVLGLYAGVSGAVAGGIVGFAIGVLSGAAFANTVAWNEAIDRELDGKIWTPPSQEHDP